MAENGNELTIKLTIDGREAEAGLDRIKGEFAGLDKEAENAGAGSQSALKGIEEEAAKTNELLLDSNAQFAGLKNTAANTVPGHSGMNSTLEQFSNMLGSAEIFLQNARVGSMNTAGNIQAGDEDAMTGKAVEQFSRDIISAEESDKAITSIHQQYSGQRNQIDQKEGQVRQQNLRHTLNLISSSLGHHTAAYKAITIAQAYMDTYAAAEVALKSAPPPFNFALAAAVVAAGLANVSKIISIEPPKMPAYARGGAIVGENGIEIIAPAEEYASGMAELVASTAFEVRNHFNSNNSSSNDMLLKEVRLLNSKIEELAARPSVSVFDQDTCDRIGRNIDFSKWSKA